MWSDYFATNFKPLASNLITEFFFCFKTVLFHQIVLPNIVASWHCASSFHAVNSNQGCLEFYDLFEHTFRSALLLEAFL